MKTTALKTTALRTLLTLTCIAVTTCTAHAGVRSDLRAQLRAAIDAALSDPTAEVQLREVRTSQDALLRRARAVTSVTLLTGERPHGSVTARAELRMAGGQVERVFVMATVDVSVPVWVVAQRMGRGAPLNDVSVTRQLRPLRGLSTSALRASTALTGLLAARSMRAGTVLTRGATTTPVLVRRGASVAVNVRVGGVLVRARGKAVRNGRLGEQVGVRLEPSRRIITGSVAGFNEVSVTR